MYTPETSTERASSLALSPRPSPPDTEIKTCPDLSPLRPRSRCRTPACTEIFPLMEDKQMQTIPQAKLQPGATGNLFSPDSCAPIVQMSMEMCPLHPNHTQRECRRGQLWLRRNTRQLHLTPHTLGPRLSLWVWGSRSSTKLHTVSQRRRLPSAGPARGDASR